MGLVVAIAFAVLSYLWWFFAVAIFAASAGYSLGYALMSAITPNATLINWIVGIVVALVVAFIVLRFNLQKWAIIIISSFLGAGIMIFMVLSATGNVPAEEMVARPVQAAIQDNFLWLLFFLAVGAAGIYVPWRANRLYTIEEYNRLA